MKERKVSRKIPHSYCEAEKSSFMKWTKREILIEKKQKNKKKKLNEKMRKD